MTDGLPLLPSLKRQRLRRAMPQSELAKRSKMARSTIIKLERGETGARPTTLQKLCRVLECAPEDLFHTPI